MSKEKTIKKTKMKKTKHVIIISLILGVIGFACKKEDNNMLDEQNTNYSENILKSINKFKQTMESGVKSGGSMHIDTAVWNLEALISYENAYPDSSSRDFITVESYYTLHVDADSMATDAAVQAVYQLMLDSVDHHLSQIDAGMKFLVFCDVELIEVVGNTAFVQATNGYGFNLVLGWYTPFDDDWIWGSLGSSLAGNCSGTDFTSDGSNEIQYRLNHPAVQIPGPGSYTDYVTVYRTDSDLDFDRRIYWDFDGILNNCLNINNLNDYLTEAHDLIYSYDDPLTPNYIEGFRPQGKDFISIEITDEWISDPNMNSDYLHQYKITYAKPFIIQE